MKKYLIIGLILFLTLILFGCSDDNYSNIYNKGIEKNLNAFSFDCKHNIICYYKYGLTCVYVPYNITECS